MAEPLNEANHIMALKAIAELQFGVGAKFLTSILHGDENSRVKEHKFQKNKYFGCLFGFSEEEIKRLLNELEYNGFIETKKPKPTKKYKNQLPHQ